LKTFVAERTSRRNDFAEVFKNLASYRSKNNYIGPSEVILNTHARISKFFVILSLSFIYIYIYIS